MAEADIAYVATAGAAGLAMAVSAWALLLRGRLHETAVAAERERVEAKEEQAVCWRLRSREGGLAESLARLDPQATGNERA